MPDAGPPSTDLKRLRLRYAGTCFECGTALAKGVDAFYDAAGRRVRCIECPGAGPVEVEIDTGTAGASATREYERRRLARQERVKSRYGKLVGGALLAINTEPQSTRAWSQGALGEQKLAQALAGLDGIRVLHDRRVPGTRGNLDHLVIAPAGVFVVDAKRYRGLIRIRDRGGWFKKDLRLYVGDRDCSHLAENMAWQMSAVRSAMEPQTVEVTSVLCFVEGQWPLIAPPESYAGVRLEGTRSIRKLLQEPVLLDPTTIDHLTRLLALAFLAN